MQITGSQRLPADRASVWHALNDPAMLKASLPGCEKLDPRSDGANGYLARMVVKVGPIKARFDGEVEIAESNGRDRMILRGNGSGGLAGFAKGANAIELIEIGHDETDLRYCLTIDVGGHMASLGAKTIEPVLKRNADQFFERFSLALQTPPREPETSNGQAEVDADASRKHDLVSAASAPVDWLHELRRERREGMWVGVCIGALLSALVATLWA